MVDVVNDAFQQWSLSYSSARIIGVSCLVSQTNANKFEGIGEENRYCAWSDVSAWGTDLLNSELTGD